MMEYIAIACVSYIFARVDSPGVKALYFYYQIVRVVDFTWAHSG